jgi:hypothetical protein
VCVRRKRVVELVIVRLERLGSNQAEIRPRVVPPAFWGGASSAALGYLQCQARSLNTPLLPPSLPPTILNHNSSTLPTIKTAIIINNKITIKINNN